MDTKQSRRRTIRNLVLVLLGLGACGGIIYFGFMLLFAYSLVELAPTFHNPVCDPATPSGIESVTHMKLPPSATNLTSFCGGWQGIGAEAQFDMEPSDLATFVNSTNVKLPLSPSNKPEKLKCFSCGKFTEVDSYLYGTYSAPEWFEEIFIDTSNPAHYRVYFTLLAG
jgi:hypothetical protein